MHSLNTKLDCDDCVCLLPNGVLVLHLTPKTYERIPIQHKKQSAKKFGLLKYGKYSYKRILLFWLIEILSEIQIDLTNEKFTIDELKEIFRNYKYSFYLYWEPSDDLKARNLNVFETLEKFFGQDSLNTFKTRFETNIYSTSSNLVDSIFNKIKLEADTQNWKNLLNFVGCFINDIQP